MITVSVPGKIHFMGEHAVVYGKPALLTAINLRMRVSVVAGGKKTTIVSSEPTEYAAYAARKVIDWYGIQDPQPVTVTIESDVLPGHHLGSSAATAVGVVAAITYFYKKLWNPDVINQIAYEVEKKQHGNPSGGDNTAVTMGGFLWYRKELEFLRSIWQIPLTLSPSLDHFYLINSGRPVETTGEMISLVRNTVQKKPAFMEKVFKQNEVQTKRIAMALKENLERELVDAINIGERTLEDMGVVGRKVIPCLRAIERAGGAVKILGGGGKKDGVGFLLAYHTDEHVLHTVAATHGFPIQKIQLGCEGVKLERKE